MVNGFDLTTFKLLSLLMRFSCSLPVSERRHLDFPSLGPINPVFSQGKLDCALAGMDADLGTPRAAHLWDTCANEIRQGPRDAGQIGTEQWLPDKWLGRLKLPQQL